MILLDFRVCFSACVLGRCESHATVAGHRRIRQVSEKRAAADNFFEVDVWGGGLRRRSKEGAPSQEQGQCVWSASLRSFGLILSGCFFFGASLRPVFFSSLPHFLKLSTGLVCKSAGVFFLL